MPTAEAFRNNSPGLQEYDTEFAPADLSAEGRDPDGQRLDEYLDGLNEDLSRILLGE